MRRCRGHMRIGDGARMKTCCHQTCDVRHIHHQHCTDLIGNLSEFLEINRSGICGGSCNNHLRLCFQCDLTKLIIIDKSVVIDTVGNNLEILAGNIYRTSVCQMSAVIQIHTHDGISRLTYRELYRKVCLCARVRLYIGIGTSEQFHGSVPCQILNHVHTIASAVVSLARIPFGIFVCERTSHRRHHCLAHPVLGSDQLNVAVLSLLLGHDRLGNLGINVFHFV